MLRYVGPEFDKNVGSNVARFRKARGLSQAELAAAISNEGDLIHQQTIQKIEKGSRPLKYSESVHISNVLGISPSDLSDVPARAESNSNFIAAISGVTSAEQEIDSAAEHLVRALVRLGGYISFCEEGAENFQPDAHLAEHARRILSADWANYFLERMRATLDDPMTASLETEALERVPTPSIYQQVIAHLRPQAEGGDASNA